MSQRHIAERPTTCPSPAHCLPSCFFKNHCSSIAITPTVPSGLIPAAFPVTTLCAFHFPHHMSQCALFISSSLICSPELCLIRNTDHEPTFSSYSCFLLPLTSFFSCPEVFFTTRFSYTLSCCSSHNMRDQVSHLCKLIDNIIVCIF